MQRTADLRSHQKMLQEANAKLDNLAHTDPLTDLSQSAALRRSLAIRSRPGAPLRDGLVNDDRLELVRDAERPVGDKAGDEALKAVAQMLKSRCRTTDICARLGGDEFAIILPQTGVDVAAILRQSVLDLIEQTRLQWRGEELRLGLSIGNATFSIEISDPEELMAAAPARRCVSRGRRIVERTAAA
ncbi:MAG TPA: GGDEF domain-containing protein [Bryobacteraceae bacterium]|nr:GGDEF domain-containing protein [Bryobacteraceae bacterium]